MNRAARDLVATVEVRPVLPDGQDDRFAGYAVLGVTFSQGDVLALRRFPGSSIGPGYTSVWHRDPERRWTFYQDVAADLGCSRYFSDGIARTAQAAIRIVWTGAQSFTVLVAGGDELEWSVDLASTPVTRMLTALAAAFPASAWRRPGVVRALAAAAGLALGAGRLRFSGTTPNGHRFVAMPEALWEVARSQAVIAGRRVDGIVRPERQTRLGDLWIPRCGLFAVTRARLSSS